MTPRLYNGRLQDLDNEWRKLPNAKLDIDPESCGAVHFYQQLALVKDYEGYCFKNLATFALELLALPVSNADAERLYSKLNLVKTDVRNKLGIDTLKSLLMLSEEVKDQEACYTFIPSEALLNC